MDQKNMYSPRLRSFWVDFPLTDDQYSKLKLRWRRRQNYYEVKNDPPEGIRLRSFCSFGGEDYKILSIEARGELDAFHESLKIMKQWIIDTLGDD